MNKESTSTALSSHTVHQNTSTQDVITTIVYNAVVCGGMVIAFLFMRFRFKRIYEPKSNFKIVPPNQRPEKLPKTPWGWFKTLLTRPSRQTIADAGVDGYLFLRYLKTFMMIFFCGVFTWVILLPVNMTHSKQEGGLDQLGISNVGTAKRYYAHAIVSWIFYGMTLFTIYRELVFYTNFRNAILVSPAHAGKLSTRTVIFQTVPDAFLDERRIRKLFEGVKHVWVARGQRTLQKKVNERQKACRNLENALCKLLKKAMKTLKKAEKDGHIVEPADELEQYVPRKKWPRLRPSRFSRKVDMLDFYKTKIPELNEEIDDLQKDYKSSSPMNSVAVEFVNQSYAQVAFQQRPYDQPQYFTPRQFGVEPEDIFWPNMQIFWWERITRRAVGASIITVLVIFWAIPSALVGMISNLTYLTNKITFLRFIYQLPSSLIGVITSLLPTIMMTLLMLILPMIIRLMAKLSGAISIQQIEYYTQQSYFAFQVIQVFLVTTVASSITTVITQLMDNPSSVLSLLSSNLPKCSNFFISYVLFQGFSIAGGALLQVATLVLFYCLSQVLDNTPRKKWNRFNNIGSYSWGTTFPIYTNLTVITLAYSIISPVILAFAGASFLILYICYQNNINYVFGQAPDALGIYYVRALFQSMVGVYLGEICLLGLFAVSKAWGPVILELIFLIATAFFHIQLNNAFDMHLKVLPNTVMRPLDGKTDTISWTNPKHQNDDLMSNKAASHANYISRCAHKEVLLLIDGEHGNQETKKANFLIRFFKPNTYLSYRNIQSYIPERFRELPEESPEYIEHAYDYKVVSEMCPKIWIPRDPMGISQSLIREFKDIVEIVDKNAFFDASCNVVWTGPPPEERVFIGDDISENGDQDTKKNRKSGLFAWTNKLPINPFAASKHQNIEEEVTKKESVKSEEDSEGPFA